MTAIGEQTSLAIRKRQAGQRLIIGFPSTALSDGLRALIKEFPPAGFILFARNIEEPAQVWELNRELTSLLPAALPPLLTVDQEGGRVQRISGTAWPPMRWLGNAGDVALTRQVGAAMGAELHACGFNMSWGPVADVSEEAAESVIGDRSFSADPDRAAAHVVAFGAGLRDAGVLGAVKHFPGHGATTTDSHKALPCIELDRPELERRDLRPFAAAVEAGVGAVMTAHACFPAWDEELPATLSARILRGVLREQLGYGGVIVSDDMDMAALCDGPWPLTQQLDLACRASLDAFLFCHHLDRQWQAAEQLVRLQEGDPTHDTLAQDSARRVMALREKGLLARTAPPPLSVVGCRAHKELALTVRVRGMA